MAIQNASDLVVYKKVDDSVAQVTRITAISDSAISSNGTVEIVDVVSTTGVIETIFTPTTTSTGSGGWYIEVTNQDAGNVPTLSIGTNGTAVLDLDYIEVDVITFGENYPLELIAYSTQASLNISTDLRDVTNKDSEGWAEKLGGKKAFDITTDALLDLNSTYGIKELWDTYRDRSEITLRFSTRRNNYLPDGANDISDITIWLPSNISSFVLPSVTSPDGSSTTQGLTTVGGVSMIGKYIFQYLSNKLPLNYNWTFSVYLRATSSDDKDSSAQLIFNNGGNIALTLTKLSGPGTVVGTQITDLSETEWTRVQWTTNAEQLVWSTAYYTLSPYQSSSYAGEASIYVWGPMLSKGTTATSYFNKQLHWEGACQINSLSLNAGVEDNTTYTANFTGTKTLTKVSN